MGFGRARLASYMVHFQSLAHAEQLRELDAIARAAVARFGIEVERWDLLQYERNAVYGLSARTGARYVLRISGEGGYSVAEQGSELAFLRWLRADGQPVPVPVADAAGEWVLELGSLALSPRTCVMFHWLNGELPSADISQRQLAALGAATQRLHAGSRRFSPSSGFTRPRLGWRTSLTDEVASQPHRGLLERLSGRLASELGELESEPVCLLHGDLHRDNVLVQGQHVGFIDFEDCGWGHALFDVASLLDSFRRRVVDRARYPRARAAFLEAYAPAWGTPRELTRLLCAFKALRDAITLRSIAASANESVQSWAEPRIAQLLRHIDGYLAGGPAQV